MLRRGGRLVEIAGAPRTTVDFGAGPRPAIGMSWGDIATAWRSTGIPDIEVFFESSPKLARAATLSRLFRPLLSVGVVRDALKAQVRPQGPLRSDARAPRPIPQRDRRPGVGRRHRATVRSRLVTAEAYTLTAWTAVEIARRAGVGRCCARLPNTRDRLRRGLHPVVSASDARGFLTRGARARRRH
jgi:short subunit dehydrogenase-like uncharacterized protein